MSVQFQSQNFQHILRSLTAEPLPVWAMNLGILYPRILESYSRFEMIQVLMKASPSVLGVVKVFAQICLETVTRNDKTMLYNVLF